MEEPTPNITEQDLEIELRNAKAYLLRSSSKTGENLYDHLVSALTDILEKQPQNVVDKFEEISRETKRSKFHQSPDTIRDQAEVLPEVDLAREHGNLFDQNPEIPDKIQADLEEEGAMVLQDILEHAYHFEQVNVGVGREETFRIFLALKQLSDAYNFESCRFWGKLFGTEANYIVAEANFKEGEDPYQQDEDDSHPQEESGIQDALAIEEEQIIDIDDVPKPDYKPPTVIPKDEYGTGCNSKVYFVCNEAGKSWNRLPPVTPQQIVTARQIKKFFTGRLDAEVISYPPFPGNEANYLRAQIARISAATHISPQGYYIFEESEDDEDEGAGPDHFVMNIEFEGLPVGDLADQSLSFWVHHFPFILPQGRCSWFNPSQPVEEDEEDEDEDEEREEPDEPEPESGPPLLTPLSEDTEVHGQPAWTASKSTTLIPQYAVAVLHSNLWPGAHAYCVDRKFENIYVGWGQKYNAENYSPPVPPATQEEYPSGPEITEAEDPTVEAERALKAAQQEALEQEEDDEESDEFDEDE
eukprot:gene20102-22073_t